MAAVKMIPPGTRFGRLTVVRFVGVTPNTRKAMSECKCDCGAVVVKRNNDLLTGRIVSCGCARRERSSRQMWERAERSNANHMSGTPLYHCWRDMVRRCTEPTNRRYARYGGRGITVCKSWLHSFRAFRKWAETHGFLPGLQIDRINVNDNYRPGNCRFVDRITQANNRSNNHIVEYEGEVLTIAQLARRLGQPYEKVKYAIQKKEVSSEPRNSHAV